MLDDVNAIRAVNQAYARHINAGAREEIAALFADPSDAQIDGGIVAVAADGFGELDVIEIASDRATAVVHLLPTRRRLSDPVARSWRWRANRAVASSGGRNASSSSIAYVKREGVWKILRSWYSLA